MNIWNVLKLLTQPKRLRRLLKLEKDFQQKLYLRKGEDGMLEISGYPGYIDIIDLDVRVGKEGLTLTGDFYMEGGTFHSGVGEDMDWRAPWENKVTWLDTSLEEAVKPITFDVSKEELQKLIDDGVINESQVIFLDEEE